MRILLVALGVLVALAVGALAIAPRVVDWNRYKPEIEALALRATGDRLTIDGDVALSVLPTPTLSIAGVRLAGPGTAAPELMRLTSLDARIAFGPLLAGHIVVRSIALVEPQVVLDAAAVATWAGRRASALDERLSFDRVIVVDGSVVWRDADGAPALQVDRVNAELTADAPGGPYRAGGDVAWRGLFWHFDGSIGGFDAGAPISLALGLRGGAANFRIGGTLLPGGDTLLAGRLRADTHRLPELLAASGLVGLLTDGGTAGLPAALGQPATLEATLKVARARIALDGVALTLGDDVVASGALGVALGSPPSVDLTLAVNRIDVARWSARLPPSPAVAAPPALPAGLRGSLDLAVDAVLWRGGVIRQARLAGRLDDDGFSVRQAGAQLPGGSDVSVFGRVAFGAARQLEDLRFDGRVEGGADNLRGLLTWLGLDLGAVPPDRLRRVSVTSGLALAADRVALDGIDLRFDASRLTGSVDAVLGARPAFGANLRLDRLNLEAYLPRASGAGAAGAGLGWLADLDANLELAVDRLNFDTVPLDGVHAALTLERGALTVHALTVASAAGLQASLGGTVRWDRQPGALDLAVSAQADDPSPLLQLLGDDAATSDVGPIAVSLRASGPLDHVQLVLDGGLAGGTLGATGEADLTARSLDLKLTMADLALGRALPTALGTHALDGALAGTLNLSAALAVGGLALNAPPASLSVTGALRGHDVAVSGFDLASLASLLAHTGAQGGDAVAQTVAQDLTRGRSTFATLDGGFALQGPRATTDNTTLTGGDGTVGVGGSLDLGAGTLDMTLTLQPAGDPTAPPATVRLTGALAAPTREVDARALADFLAARLKP